MAQALQKRANNIMQALVSCSLFPSIKHILKTQGVDCGGCRKPFPDADRGTEPAYIERVVKETCKPVQQIEPSGIRTAF